VIDVLDIVLIIFLKVKRREKKTFFLGVLQLLAQKTGVDLNLGELKQLVGREISSCLQPSRQHHLSNAEQQQLGKLSSSTEQLSKPSAGAEQLPKLSSDVTLTKVAAPERLSEKDKETKVTCLCLVKYF
jgi:hypothetical protein